MLPLLFGFAQGAEAQTTLVSNTGQTSTGSFLFEFATKFTTGANAAGYALSEVDIALGRSGITDLTGRTTVVTIRAGGSTNPGALVATLVNPNSFTLDALNTFTAPAGTVLAANTTYFLVFNDGTPRASPQNIPVTAARGDGQTGLTGWSINNGSRFQQSSSWFGSNQSMRFALKGTPAPAAPTGLTATPGNREVILEWNDPSNAAITKYQYRQRPAGGGWGGWTDFAASGATTVTRAIVNLTNGTEYSFEIRAVAGTLNGAASETVSATPRTPPAAPAGLTATAGAGEVVLSWTNPSNSAITEYEFRQGTGPVGSVNWGEWTDIASSSASTTTHTVTGLTGGTAYSFQVRAAIGTVIGLPSSAVSATPTAARPAAPTNFTAVAGPGGGQVTLSWTRPSGTITGYQYRARRPGGGWLGWAVMTGGADITSFVAPVGNEALDFQMRARNGNAEGEESAIVRATAVARPAAPTSVTAVAGPRSGEVTLGWGDPSNSAITKYQYRQKLDSASTWGEWTDFTGGTTATSTSGTVAGLTNGTAYDFEVRATAAPGGTVLGAASATVTATPSAPPAKPAGFTARGFADNSVTLSWTRPSNNAITKWQYRRKLSSAITWGEWTDIPSDPRATAYTVPGLTIGTTYDFQIRALVGTVEGAASDTATATPTANLFFREATNLASLTALTVVEEATGSYRVSLAGAPSGEVTVTIASDNSDVTVDTDSTAPGNQNTLTFTTTDWGTYQTVTVSAADDGDTAEDTATLTHTASGGGYDTLTGNVTVAVTVTDNDTAGLVLNPTALTVDEGDSGTYTVALATLPTGNVTVTVAGASGEVTVDTNSTMPGNQNMLSFTTTTWSTPQTVTVSAGNDGDTTNDSATLTHTASGGGYGSVTGNVVVTVEDDDTVGVTTATTDDTATEGSTSDTATFTVVLNTEPSDNVAVTVTAPAGLELAGPGSMFSGSALIAFTASTWGTAQTVTVRATDDNTDSPIGRELSVTYSTSSRDNNYHSLSGDAATVTVVDDDATTVTLAGSAGNIEEGETKTFTVTLGRGLVSGETLPVPLTFTGGATRGTDYTTACPTTLPTGVTCANLDSGNAMVTFTGPSTGTTSRTVTLTLSATTDNTNETGGETVVIGLGTLDANSGTGLGGGASGTDNLADFSINDPDSGAPTVEISGVPDRISNRDAFTATFTFSEAVTGFVTGDVTVTGGTKGTFTATSATVYTLVVTPNADADVVVTVAADSATAGTNTGPASAVSATAVWTLPPGLVFSSTALTVAEGGSGTYTVALATQPTVTVTVTVGGASGEVTVDTDANTNGNQRTLEFSTTTWGTARTVTVLAGEDEDSVNDTATLTHRASGGGYGSVTGNVAVTVTDNDEPSVFGGFAAWMPRFARVASEQILQGIGERVALHRGQGATGAAGAGRGDGAMAFEGVLAGQALVTGGGFADGERGISAVPGRAAAGGAAQAMVERARGFGEEASDPFGDRLGAPRSQTLGAREALLGTAFTLTGERDGAGGTMAFWGQAGRGDFDGRERTLLLDGEVTTGMLGVDYAWDRALVGLALTRSEGEGGYRDTHSASRADDGEVEASLTAALPYASVHATPRLKLWGATGRGGGEVTLKTPDARYRTNTEWTMAAAGMRGDFLTPLPEGVGASLALTADALWTRITSDRTRGLAASASSVTRVRLGLEGRYPLALDGDGQLTPRFEARARQDGGDAETGRGFELGAGLAFSDPALGLTLDLSGRTLIAHTDDDLKERGYQASLAFDPDPATKRGPSLGLRQEFGGRAEGGLDALFASAPLGERTGRGAKPRWAMETAWGFPALGGRFTASPHAGLGLAADAREISLGWRLTPEASTAPDLSLGLKAARRERNTALPQHTFGVEAALRW